MALSSSTLGLNWNPPEEGELGYISRTGLNSQENFVECPPLIDLLQSKKERDKLVAFASTMYIHQDVLFWAEVDQFRKTGDGKVRMAHANHIVVQYVAQKCPHPIQISDASREKLLKQWLRKAGASSLPKTFFESVKKEVEEFIQVRLYPQYESFWEDEQKLAGARTRIAQSCQFDLDNPPPLVQLLQDDSTRNQLKDFAVSVYSEENVLFWEAVNCLYLPEKRIEERAVVLKNIYETFIAKGCRMGINVAGGVRSALLASYESLVSANPEDRLPRGGSDSFFDRSMQEMLTIMSLEVYPKFIRHVRAARRELALQNDDDDEPTLKEVLQDPIQYESLLIFAAGLYTQERVVFWRLAEDYRSTTDAEKRLPLAKSLIEDYIDDNAVHQVTLDGNRKRTVLEKWANIKGDPPIKLFVSAQKEVERNMQYELFNLFLEDRVAKGKPLANEKHKKKGIRGLLSRDSRAGGKKKSPRFSKK